MTDAGLLYTILACTMGLCAGPKPTQEQAIARQQVMLDRAAVG